MLWNSEPPELINVQLFSYAANLHILLTGCKMFLWKGCEGTQHSSSSGPTDSLIPGCGGSGGDGCPGAWWDQPQEKEGHEFHGIPEKDPFDAGGNLYWDHHPGRGEVYPLPPQP